MNVRYRVDLDQTEREELTAMLAAASILHASSSGRRSCWPPMPASATRRSHEAVAGGSTVYRTKRRFVKMGLEAALSEEPRPGAERKLTGKEEASDRHRLLQSAAGPRPLDTGTAGRRVRQADRA